jgi:uncharacterized protein with FMN-binding domain
MPRRGAIAIAITGLALVLLLSFKTPDEPALAGSGSDLAAGGGAATATPSTGATGGTTDGASGGGATATATPTPAPSPTADGAYVDGTVEGATVNTRFGPVQVEVTISGGRIADIVTLQLPWNDRRSVELSEYAASVLREAALQAQTADLDLVSGATYTSDAYVRSLQSALDQAQA